MDMDLPDRDRLVQLAAGLLVGIGGLFVRKLRKVAAEERPRVVDNRRHFNARLRKLFNEKQLLEHRVNELELEFRNNRAELSDRMRELEVQLAHVQRLAKG